MKPTITFAAGALALAMAGSVSAQTVVRIVASNGDRTATQTAISKLLSSSAAGPGGNGWVFQGTGGNTSAALIANPPAGTTAAQQLAIATNANFGAWNGRFGPNLDPVVIKVSYAGALAGVAAVAGGQADQKFVVTDGLGTGAVPNPLTTATNQLGKADFGFSTNFQSTSPYNGLFGTVDYQPLLDEIVGVSPLGFYASPGFPGSPSSTNPAYLPNITTQLAQQLYTSGSLRLSSFTGDYANDYQKTVWAIGRNTDAGQRFGAYTEIGLGTSTNVKVWQPTITGATTDPVSGIIFGGTATSHKLWPAETFSGISVPVGSGGYTSGALLADKLTLTLGAEAYTGVLRNAANAIVDTLYPNATAGYYIGYATPGDANNRILGGNGVVPAANRGVALSYNGVPLTDANVRSGRYTAWLYNRLLRPSTGIPSTTPALDGNARTALADALRDQIKNVDAVSGGGLLDDASFKVERSTDGGFVTPKDPQP